MKDMKIVQEMYARGFDFMPIDIYRAKAKKFQIIDGKLMPSLASIEGMGTRPRRRWKRRRRTGRICHWMISGSGPKSARL